MRIGWALKGNESRIFQGVCESREKLSGKMLDSVRAAIQEVIDAQSVDQITDCKKLIDFDYVYRIRIGSYRAFFTFHVHIENDVVMFEYLLPRGEAYDKKNQEKLRRVDE